MSRPRIVAALSLTAALVAGAPAIAEEPSSPGAMVEQFIEYVYSASPRDAHGLKQTAWLMRHCAQPLCDKLEHQIHSRKTTDSRIAVVLSVTEKGNGQWDAEVRLDTTKQGGAPVVMVRAMVLLDANGKVVTLMSELYR